MEPDTQPALLQLGYIIESFSQTQTLSHCGSGFVVILAITVGVSGSGLLSVPSAGVLVGATASSSAGCTDWHESRLGSWRPVGRCGSASTGRPFAGALAGSVAVLHWGKVVDQQVIL